MSTETKPEVKPLTISASQLDDFLDCPRRWWFKRIMKLKEVQKNYFTFGTVLHGCIERWMAGDKQGRVPEPVPEVLVGQTAGEPVNVYPEGWETIDEKGSKVSVTPNEAKLIQRLFREAVERGIIARDDRSTVEREIRLPVLEHVEVGEQVNLLGYIDIHVAGDAEHGDMPEIHDHKSFGKSSTRYLKQPGPTDEGGNPLPITTPYEKGDGTSPNSVGHNQQVLTYAVATSIIDGYHGPVKVRHNQYPKFQDPKGVRKVEAIVAPERLADHWAFVQDTAKRMRMVAKIKKWTDTPPPSSPDSCSRYGGCPFLSICGKRESPEVYSQRIERTAAQANKGARPNLPLPQAKRKTTKKKDTGGTTMDIFARAKSQQAARTGGTAAAAPATKTMTKPATAAVTAAKAAANPKPAANKVNSTTPPVAAVVTDGAPWADPKCPACKGVGINSKGRACPICDKTAVKREKPTSSMYQIEIGDDGQVTAVLNDEHADTGAEEAWVGQVPVSGSAPAPTKPKPSTKPAPAPAPVQEQEAAPDEDPGTDAPEEATDAPEEEQEAPAPVVVTVPKGREAAKAALTRSAASTPPTPAKAQTGAGRPRAGIVVLIGASMLKGPDRPTLMAQELLETVGAELATDMGATSYWELDAFKRRERIRQKGAQIAEGLGRTIVIVAGGTNDPDVMSLVGGLVPHAEFVFEGLR